MTNINISVKKALLAEFSLQWRAFWQEKIGGLVSFVHGDNVSFSLFYIFYQGEKSKFL